MKIIILLIIGSDTTKEMLLPFHLPDVSIEFGTSDISQLTLFKLKFMSWMKCNAIYPDSQCYPYAEFPTSFVWDKKIRDWRP